MRENLGRKNLLEKGYFSPGPSFPKTFDWWGGCVPAFPPEHKGPFRCYGMGLCLWECIEDKACLPVCGSIVWEFAHGSKDLRDSNRPKVLAKGGEGPHWHVWGGKFALERLPLPSSMFLFFPLSKRDVLNGFYGLSGHGVHVGIVDGGSRGVEMPAAAEEGCHGAYVIAAG